jgi:hypothetical protein
VRTLAVPFLFVSLPFALMACNGQQSAANQAGATVAVVQGTVAGTLGLSLKDYDCPAYPVNNFGLGTSWDSSADPPQMICDPATCLGINKTDAQTNELDGYAFAGSGGPIEIKNSANSDYALSAVVPELLQVLDINLSAEAKNTMSANLSITGATIRYLNRDKMISHINNDPTTPPTLKSDFQQGKLTIVTSDVVANGLAVTITVDPTKNASLKASLDGKLAGGAGKVVGQGANLQVTLDSSQSNQYTLNTNSPVVVCRLQRKQPTAGGLAASPLWNDWPIDTTSMPGPRAQ